MAPPARPVTLTRRGDPAHDATLDEVERGFAQLRADVNTGTLTGTTAASWAGTAPTTTASAINRMAAALADLLGTPIP